jgi:hypothetical protein
VCKWEVKWRGDQGTAQEELPSDGVGGWSSTCLYSRTAELVSFTLMPVIILGQRALLFQPYNPLLKPTAPFFQSRVLVFCKDRPKKNQPLLEVGLRCGEQSLPLTLHLPPLHQPSPRPPGDSQAWGSYLSEREVYRHRGWVFST